MFRPHVGNQTILSWNLIVTWSHWSIASSFSSITISSVKSSPSFFNSRLLQISFTSKSLATLIKRKTHLHVNDLSMSVMRFVPSSPTHPGLSSISCVLKKFFIINAGTQLLISWEQFNNETNTRFAPLSGTKEETYSISLYFLLYIWKFGKSIWSLV